MKLCIVEDQGYQAFYPLTKTRPVFDLRCGKFTIEERLLEILEVGSEPLYYLIRHELQQIWKSKHKRDSNIIFDVPTEGDRLILNGRVLFHEEQISEIISKTQQNKGGQFLWLCNDTWAAMYIPEEKRGPGSDELFDGKFDYNLFNNQMYMDVGVITYPWELNRYNAKMIRSDFGFITKRLQKLRFPPLHKQVAILNAENLIIGKHSEIYPFVTLDCTHGPVIIGDNVTIESGAYIKGPVCIGDNCLISANTKLYTNTTLGETCKVGGEISHSIIHGFSNKRHSGFLGNSYIGKWVNLGAGTNTSNMKNNYNAISVRLNGKKINTGQQFLGLYMGDHSRSAIDTSFNTASFIGVGCNIFGEGIPKKNVRDFTWGGIEDFELYEFKKFIENARRMMIRREIELSDEEILLLKSLHNCRTTELGSKVNLSVIKGNGFDSSGE
ncbi:MAG: hypothetical protein HUJ22_02620 [Gracilimonas sp.]|uniref:putative sugar nucleotidyl transferase n=1 Tax=Gracilimonas sp. TaxID=1974203 RepID=UPI0019BF391C|nr:putative sugar nucleotidyl transferase [Gracilimonas sp.]MBD3615439.1 hypothetical protein [Gracilimonas sp.]